MDTGKKKSQNRKRKVIKLKGRISNLRRRINPKRKSQRKILANISNLLTINHIIVKKKRGTLFLSLRTTLLNPISKRIKGEEGQI